MLAPLTPIVRTSWWNTHLLTKTLEKEAALYTKNHLNIQSLRNMKNTYELLLKMVNKIILSHFIVEKCVKDELLEWTIMGLINKHSLELL
jgi:hypothetical protein